MFNLEVPGRQADEPITGELMQNGLVRVFARGSGLSGLVRPDGSEPRGDLMGPTWGPHIARAVAEHFGYER